MTQDTSKWSDMTREVMNTWIETNSQVWNSWFELMGNVPNSPFVKESKSTINDLSQRLTHNQELLVRFFQLSYKAWQDIYPKVKAGDSWQEVLDAYSGKLYQQLESFAKQTQNTQQLWQLYLKEVQTINQLWTASLGSLFQPMSQALAGTGEPWTELNTLYWDIFYQDTWGKYLSVPLVGPNRELTGKILKGFDSWTLLYRASQQYQLVLADVQVRSFEALMKKLVEMAENGEFVTDVRKFQLIWGKVADKVFEEAFCEEKNLKIRGQFLNALNAYRLEQQKLMEVGMRGVNLPTRSEVDEMHKTIYELRKEVKKMKKILEKSQNQDHQTHSEG